MPSRGDLATAGAWWLLAVAIVSSTGHLRFSVLWRPNEHAWKMQLETHSRLAVAWMFEGHAGSVSLSGQRGVHTEIGPTMSFVYVASCHRRGDPILQALHTTLADAGPGLDGVVSATVLLRCGNASKAARWRHAFANKSIATVLGSEPYSCGIGNYTCLAHPAVDPSDNKHLCCITRSYVTAMRLGAQTSASYVVVFEEDVWGARSFVSWLRWSIREAARHAEQRHGRGEAKAPSRLNLDASWFDGPWWGGAGWSRTVQQPLPSERAGLTPPWTLKLFYYDYESGWSLKLSHIVELTCGAALGAVVGWCSSVGCRRNRLGPHECGRTLKHPHGDSAVRRCGGNCSCSSSCIMALWVGALNVFTMYAVGRQHLGIGALNRRVGHSVVGNIHAPAYGQGIVYPRQYVEEIASYLEHRAVESPLYDHLLTHYIDSNNGTEYLTVPSLLQHTGWFTSRPYARQKDEHDGIARRLRIGLDTSNFDDAFV